MTDAVPDSAANTLIPLNGQRSASPIIVSEPTQPSVQPDLPQTSNVSAAELADIMDIDVQNISGEMNRPPMQSRIPAFQNSWVASTPNGHMNNGVFPSLPLHVVRCIHPSRTTNSNAFLYAFPFSSSSSSSASNINNTRHFRTTVNRGISSRGRRQRYVNPNASVAFIPRGADPTHRDSIPTIANRSSANLTETQRSYRRISMLTNQQQIAHAQMGRRFNLQDLYPYEITPHFFTPSNSPWNQYNNALNHEPSNPNTPINEDQTVLNSARSRTANHTSRVTRHDADADPNQIWSAVPNFSQRRVRNHRGRLVHNETNATNGVVDVEMIRLDDSPHHRTNSWDSSPIFTFLYPFAPHLGDDFFVMTPSGLNRQSIQNLPKYKGKLKPDEYCPICLDVENCAESTSTEDSSNCAQRCKPHNQKLWFRSLPKCGHEFHAICIDRWLAQKNNCPVCRKTVSPA